MSPARERLVVLGVAAVLTALAVAAELTTDVHNDHSQLYISFGLAVTWSFVVAGLVARHRRPDNRTGLLMTGVGLAWVLNAFGDAPVGAGVAVAIVSSSLWAAALLHLVLAYPSGHLTTRRTRLIVIAAYLDTVGLAALLTPFTEPRLDGADRGTALNPLLISHQSGLVSALNGVSLAFGLALVAATLVVLIRRWSEATVTVRRELKPVYLTGIVALAALAVFALASQASAIRNSGLPFVAFSLALAAVPQGFLYGLLRTQIGRSSAVSGLIAEVERSDEPHQMRAALRRALGDPTLDLVYRCEPGPTYVDVDGGPIDPPQRTAARAVTSIDANGGRVLQMVHDAALLQDPGLFDAATTAAAMALKNHALTAELRSQLAEVAASEQRLRVLLENLRMIAVSLDLEGRITYVNPFLCELSGWSRAELLGRDWLEVFNGTEVQFLERMARDDVLPYEENWIRTRSGKIIDVAWNNTVTRNRDGRVVGATSIGEDITERRRAERRMDFQLTIARALAGAERLEDVAEPLVEALGTTFTSWAAVYWKVEDDALDAVAVWARDDVPESFVKAVYAARPRAGEGIAGDVWQHGTPHWKIGAGDDVVLNARRNDGVCGSFAFPIKAGGVVDAVVQLCSDDPVVPDDNMLALTEAAADRIGQLIERRRAEQAVIESEARKSTILSSALDCIVTIDGDGNILEFNPAAERTFGRRAEDVMGKEMAELLVPPSLRQMHREGLRRHVTSGGGQILGALVELTGMRADGSEFPIELAVTRIEALGEPMFTAFIRDITDRKRVEAELRNSRARIVKAGDDERRRLERNLHDGAQQRLVSLSLSLRLARSQFKRDPGSADRILEAAGEELAEALAELRELARGIHPAILTDRGLRPALEALAGRSSVPVELLETPEVRLPAQVEAAAYYVAAEALTNVSRYAQARSATVRVMHESDTAVIEVVDDGVGGADPGLGTGLRGLADRVDALDGRLIVESPIGAGTTVRAVIPCG
jgi:PAS domain S-box-containing protein